MILLLSFAVMRAVGMDNGYATVYLENISFVVMLFSLPLLPGSSGSKSTCLTFVGPKFHPGVLPSSGANFELSFFCLARRSIFLPICGRASQLMEVDGK